ncbi:MAG: hypothetical protein EOP06_16690, partial [Proteobacteria bacterium]
MRNAGQRLVTFDDFRLLSKPDCTFSGDLLLYLNPSLFKSGREYRYYVRNRSIDSQRDTFRIMTIPKKRLLKKLFNYVKEPVSCSSLITFVEHELEQADGEHLIADLVHEQILFHSQMPAITRNEFTSLGQELPDSSNSYTIAYHKQRSGADISYQAKLYDGLWALGRLAAKVPFTELRDFAKKFAERFGEVEVPLLRALDPQTGISYLGSERTVLQHEDAHEVNAQQKLDLGHAEAALNRLMIRKLMDDQRAFQEGIVFTRAEINSLEKLDELPLLLPPSIAVTFRLFGE